MCSIPRIRNILYGLLRRPGTNGNVPASRTSPETPSGNGEGSPNSASKLGAGRVFRIRGIPVTWEIEDIRSILVHHEDMKVQDKAPDPTIISLAEEAHGQSKVGTVKFRVLPTKLDKIHLLSIRVPSTSNNGQLSTPKDIILALDDEFFGITTLYCPSPEDYKAE
jgi:protein SERAC1